MIQPKKSKNLKKPELFDVGVFVKLLVLMKQMMEDIIILKGLIDLKK